MSVITLHIIGLNKKMIGNGYNPFLKVATIPVDLLFIELMLHLSHVKQMLSPPINLAHEMIL